MDQEMFEEVVIEYTSYEPYPAGTVVVAEITHIEKTVGRWGDQLRWSFSIVDDNRSLSGWTTARFSQRSKAYAWAKAALGDKLRDGDPFRSSELNGQRVALTLGIKTNDEDGSSFNIIEEVSPAAGQKRFGGIFS